MLTGLSIRDIVLIDRLDLSFDGGLTVLTGETGAGKSILLDALGLALGVRADSAMVRPGAKRASITARFELADTSAIRPVLEAAGLDGDGGGEGGGEGEGDGLLLLRRVLGADGRSHAFVNDQPVSVGTLRNLGDALVEIQGQFDTRGLLDPATHIGFLDDFAQHDALIAATGEAFLHLAETRQAYEAAQANRREAEQRENFLRHAVQELDQLAPVAGEYRTLTERRTLLANAESLIEAVGQALELVAGDEGAETSVAAARRALDRVVEKAGGRLSGVVAAFERTTAELQETASLLSGLVEEIETDDGRLEEVEDRIHALRDAARKHNVEPEALEDTHRTLLAQLESLDAEGTTLASLEARVDAAVRAYQSAAARLTHSRQEAAVRLDAAVMAELPPLKLEKARFATGLQTLPPERWSPRGQDRVTFLVAANPGSREGPLNKVASGGELSRLLLALRVALAWANPLPTLIFDEVDAGVGGAVAAAVGDRLERLGTGLQVLVVTHSPQVAAKGRAHWRIAKGGGEAEAAVVTTASLLDPAHRQEEIARMLAGATITPEARAAAEQLLQPTRLAGRAAS